MQHLLCPCAGSGRCALRATTAARRVAATLSVGLRAVPAPRRRGVARRQALTGAACAGTRAGDAAASGDGEARDPSVSACPRLAAGPRLAAVAAAAALVLAPWTADPLPSAAAADAGDKLVVRFRAARDPELRGGQELLVQAWAYVRELYVDPTFNNQDWRQALEKALDETFRSGTREGAEAALETLLATLDDPFTRVLLPGRGSEAYAAQLRSAIVSHGMLVGRTASDAGRLLVTYVVPGSPAEAAGVEEGDLVVAVDGTPAAPGREVSFRELLRQDNEVDVKLLRPARPAPVPARGGSSGSSFTRDATGGSDGSATGPRALPSAPSEFAVPQPPQALAERQHDSGEPSASAAASAAAAAPTAATAVAVGPPAGELPTTYQLPGRFFSVHLTPGPTPFVPVQFGVLSKPPGPPWRTAPSLSTAAATATSAAPAAGAGAGADASAAPAPPTPAPAPALPRVGYIHVSAFVDGVGPQVEAAIAALKAAGCGSWLLDLRDNPGGLVEEGKAVAELLLRPGDVFTRSTGRDGVEAAEVVAEGARSLLDGQPLAVLVNSRSASVAELLAGALRDDARAVLFGQTTYGKGRTQRVLQLPGDGLLTVSTDGYVTPARRPVQGVGLSPDITCRSGGEPPPPSAVASADRGRAVELAAEVREELLEDGCVRTAVEKLSRGVVRVRAPSGGGT